MRECETTRHRRGVVLTTAGGMVLLLRDLANEDQGGRVVEEARHWTGEREKLLRTVD